MKNSISVFNNIVAEENKRIHNSIMRRLEKVNEYIDSIMNNIVKESEKRSLEDAYFKKK